MLHPIKSFLTFFGLLILTFSVDLKAQDTTESVIVPDTSLNLLDILDAVRDPELDSLVGVLDSIIPPQKIIKAIPDEDEYNKVLRSVPQEPLPPTMKLSIMDSANVGSQHIDAIKDYFRKPFEAGPKRSLFDVRLLDTLMMSSIYVESWPLKLAQKDLRNRYLFQSEEEKELYADSLSERFKREICIRLQLKSPYATAISLDSASIEDISLLIGGRTLEIKPFSIALTPVVNRLWGYVTWYEREIRVCFPHYIQRRDIWKRADLELRVKMGMNENPDFATEYYVKLN